MPGAVPAVVPGGQENTLNIPVPVAACIGEAISQKPGFQVLAVPSKRIAEILASTPAGSARTVGAMFVLGSCGKGVLAGVTGLNNGVAVVISLGAVNAGLEKVTLYVCGPTTVGEDSEVCRRGTVAVTVKGEDPAMLAVGVVVDGIGTVACAAGPLTLAAGLPAGMEDVTGSVIVGAAVAGLAIIYSFFFCDNCYLTLDNFHYCYARLYIWLLLLPCHFHAHAALPPPLTPRACGTLTFQ